MNDTDDAQLLSVAAWDASAEEADDVAPDGAYLRYRFTHIPGGLVVLSGSGEVSVVPVETVRGVLQHHGDSEGAAALAEAARLFLGRKVRSISFWTLPARDAPGTPPE